MMSDILTSRRWGNPLNRVLIEIETADHDRMAIFAAGDDRFSEKKMDKGFYRADEHVDAVAHASVKKH